MTVAITTALNEAQLAAVASFIDSGTASGRIRIYGGTRPATVNDAPSTAMLVEIVLTEPCGSVSDGQLSLSATGLAQIVASGVSTWARVVNGNGDTALDADVSAPTGAGDVQISNTTLYAGAFVTLISAVLA